MAALRRYEILDTEPEQEFDDIVSLVKSIFHTRYASITLIDIDRQWNKATAGAERREYPRRQTFCDHTIRGSGPMAISNALHDSRFQHLDAVTGDASIRSYLGVPLTSPDGYNIGAICVFDTEMREFSEAEKAVLQNFSKVVISQLELRLIARQDSLTGSLTRRAFLERLDREIATGATATLLMLDVDHFKAVNDTYGHSTGDEVLKAVATTARRNLRRGDSFGRLGGEEFGILLSGTDGADALHLAERLRSDLAGRRHAMIDNGVVTLSLGVAEHRPGETRDEWLLRADQALYAAKSSGRNRSVLAR
ncbi:sensor domain-containing diguanylate cyclase [Pseudogemmobacter sp. CC-YST710]|uniref:diguanylate cyclase n=2 Tax=Pseudogemmobacter faecipullorum TaxID=2755041 RepID=A0ABS8CP06_9RHOB|nr:sensor domain-containing diguanylate cyclase [Pseudogemmobacter faecipullorum]